jgi:hypothetical protein
MCADTGIIWCWCVFSYVISYVNNNFVCVRKQEDHMLLVCNFLCK